MSEMDINKTNYLKEMLSTLPYKYFFKIHTIYNLKVSQDWRIQERKNKDLHLIFVKEGHGCYSVENQMIELKPGRLIFVSNNCLHSSNADTKNLPSIIPIRFGIYNINHDYCNLLKTPFFYTTTVLDFSAFRDKFEKLFVYHNRLELIGREHLCHCLLYEIFSEMLIAENERLHMKDQIIVDVKNYIDKRGNHKLKMNDLARHYSLSSKHLYRLFKEHYGITPKQYLIHSLLEKADYYIENTTLTLSEIAIRLGYPDVYTFSKQYKQSKLIPPSFKREG